MARQPKNDDKKEESVTSLSNEPIEPLPEQSGEVTKGIAAANREPQMKGQAVGVDPTAEKAPTIKWYRVLAAKRIQGMTGYRAVLPAGKELSSQHYNISKLRAQGVQLQELKPEEVSQF